MSDGLKAAARSGGFARRHRFLLLLLWVQIPALAAVGIVIGEPVDEIALTSLALVALALGGMALRGRHRAAITVSLGLLGISGVVVHYAGGTDFSHFHFLLTICAVSLYGDVVSLSTAVVGVAAYHAVVVAGEETWAWAGAHTGVSIALAMLLAIGWRVTKPTPEPDRSGDRFRMSFDEAPIGMAVLKPSGEVLEINRSMARILGQAQGSLVGSNIATLIHTDDQVELGEAWEQMGNSQGHSASEWMRWYTADGHSIWGKVSLSLVPRTDDHSAMVILQLEDASSAYEEQRRLETLLKGRDEFVAAVGDEIRQPLGLLIDLTGMAEHSHVNTRETLPRIEAHAREIAAIVDDLVVSARAETTPESVAAHKIDVETLCREVVSGTPGGGDISMRFQATEAWADPNLTRQIVNNLVNNALRYGGPLVALRTISSGPDTVIQVTDDGPELPGPERERVFSGDLRSGSPVTEPAAVGLSLTVSRHLARQMEGDVVYRRTKEGLNLFELRLPSEEISAIPRRRGVMERIVPT